MTNKVIIANLFPSGIYCDKKENKITEVFSLKNSNNIYRKNNNNNEFKKFNSMNENNYVYLGSTNNTVFNNMGVTLEDDGSLFLIRGKTNDLFSGMYKKYINKGFKYNGFNIKGKESELMKFKELYVDSNGDLIGNRRDENYDNTSENKDGQLYKIKFNKIENKYNLNETLLSDKLEDIYIEYEEYVPKDTEKHDLSSINNIVEQLENNILKVNRKDLNFTIKLKDNQLFVSDLPATLSEDEVDSGSKEYQVKLPLKANDKIVAIKPINNQIQIIVDKIKKTKIYYLNPSLIFATKDFKYEVRRLEQQPPLSFYSLVGENNYKNYHSGQPFSSQSPSHFSSRNIPFFSSFIDNARVHIAKAKQGYALKEYKSMVSNIAKSIDPGFRGLFSNIKGIINSSTVPCENKYQTLNNIKKNITETYHVLNKYIKGINNRKTQGEVIYSLVKDLKEKNSITITDNKGIRAFFGMNAFDLSKEIGINAFLLASYSKTHSITLSKNEKNEVIFSFINNKDAHLSAGLSAGIGGYEKRWKKNNVDYGTVIPLMASAYLSLNYERQSNFSFKISLNDVADFIDQGLHFTHDKLQYNTTFNDNKNISLGISADIRNELSFGVNLQLDKNTEMSVPRNAVGVNIMAGLLKLNININKFFDYGEIKEAKKETVIDFKLFEIILDVYRDLKFSPSKTTSTNEVQWFPLATMKNFEFMIQKKINSLFKINVFNSKELRDEKEFESNKKNLKGIYKRVLKINKLFDEHPMNYFIDRNIDKLDSIYLTMLSNKKLENKIKKDPKVKTENDIFKNIYNLDAKNSNIQKLLLELKERKEILSSQEKDNMNERFKASSNFQYKLDQYSENLYHETKRKFDETIRRIREDEEITLDSIKDELEKLYQECNNNFKKMKYQLDSIDLMSVSEILDKDKSIPLVLVQLENRKGIIHRQIKGEVKFNYDENNKQLENISTNYYF